MYVYIAYICKEWVIIALEIELLFTIDNVTVAI